MKFTPSPQLTRLAFFAGIFLFFYACATRKPTTHGNTDLDRLAALMQGSFTSAVQARRDTNYADISIEMFPIWENRKDGHWIYVEQALTALKGKPFRQRIYHITQRLDSSFVCEVFNLPNESDFINAYARPEKFKALSPEQLDLRDGCALILHKQDEGFVGETEGKGCDNNLRGAKYTHTNFEISQAHLSIWDKGVDAQGRLVWGAPKGPYEYIRK